MPDINPPPADYDDGDQAPTGGVLRGAAVLVWLALVAAIALVLVDYSIKRDLIRAAQQLREQIAEEGADDGRREQQPPPDHSEGPLPSRGHLGGLESDTGTPADGVAPGHIAHGAGGLLARGTGDGSIRDES